MFKRFLRTVSLFCAMLIIISAIPAFTFTVYAAFENTHVNTGNMAADVVAVARTQVGYLEGSLAGTTAGSNNVQKYGLWYDNNVDYIGVQRAAWCAAFVSWCANQAGVPSSIAYYHAYCPYGVTWYKNQGCWQASASRGGSYAPKAGDIIYFQSGSVTSHVGIVSHSDGTYVYTIEGNTSGQQGEVNEGGGVFSKKYSLSYSNILGYGTPKYQDNSGHTITFETNGGTAVSSVNIKEGELLSEPATPSKWGFDFGGWYCNPELTDPYDFSTPVPYGFTLYAKWNEAYWGANVNLMPFDGQLQFNSFNDNNETVWPYYNSDGSVTLYNGATNEDNWTWPTAYMEYANSFDTANDAYVYVKKDGDAKFNATITYMDDSGEYHDIKLSQLAGCGDEDFDAGYAEILVNLGEYANAQGHVPASGNLKYSKVTYYVVGAKDSYVKLYDMKLTPAIDIPDPYKTLYSKDIEQISGVGCYTYDKGVLYLSSTTDNAYTVKLPANQTFNPNEMVNLLADVSCTVPYNITLDITSANGNASVELRKEFFDRFGLTETPDALPAGTFTGDMNINGYFYYNGGLVEEATVTSFTITLYGQGDLSLCALQVSRKTAIEYVTDQDYFTGSSDSTQFPTALTSNVYTVTQGYISRVDANTTAQDFLANFDQTTGVTVYDKNGIVLDSGVTVQGGMTVVLANGTTQIASYTIAVTGDVNEDGEVTSLDARKVLSYLIDPTILTDAQKLAADFNNIDDISTADARAILKSLL